MHQINLRISDGVYARLGKLSKKTGHTKTHFVKEALVEYLDDLEDTYLALEVLKEHKKSGTMYNLDEVEKVLGLRN